jgi:rod shape-determining protein MreD
MMRVALLALFTYLAAVAETSLVDAIGIGGIAPDMLALVALVWLLTARGPWAFLAAGAIALVADLIAPGRIGVGAAWMLLVGYAVTRARMRLKVDHLAIQAPAVFAAVAVWAAGVGLTGRLVGDVSLPWWSVLSRSAGVGLYTAAASVPVLMVVGWIREPLLAREKRLAEF